MADHTDLAEVGIQAAADLEAYTKTLSHAEALHCIDYLGMTSARTATYGIFLSDRAYRLGAPMVGFAVHFLARRAARTRPDRPGGRAAYNHDDCSCVRDLCTVMDQLSARINAAKRGAL